MGVTPDVRILEVEAGEYQISAIFPPKQLRQAKRITVDPGKRVKVFFDFR